MKPDIREALEWLVNLGHGVGRAGGPPEHGEIETALEFGKDALVTSSPEWRDSGGVALIAAERERQKSVEGWTLQHDDDHDNGEMRFAAECYMKACDYGAKTSTLPMFGRWPWAKAWWKPSDDPIRNLVKAGALIAAEIDRLQRAALPSSPSPEPQRSTNDKS